jgi:hypothetical protein
LVKKSASSADSVREWCGWHPTIYLVFSIVCVKTQRRPLSEHKYRFFGAWKSMRARLFRPYYALALTFHILYAPRTALSQSHSSKWWIYREKKIELSKT